MENSEELIQGRNVWASNKEWRPVLDRANPTVAPKPRLLDQVRHAIRTRHYSYMTVSPNLCSTTLPRSDCSHGSSVPTRSQHSYRFTISIAKR